jgi:flagellar hook assembly protein FlgD
VSDISFSRLKANDVDVTVPAIRITKGNPVASVPLPVRYTLRSTPNPFNPSTRVEFTIPDGAGLVPVALRVYDVSGRVLRTLVEGTRGPGWHHVEWDGRDASGSAVSAGIYLLRIEAGAWSEVEKVALVK